MKIKSPLSEFCEKRGIDGRIKEAFGMWIRSTYAEKFRLARDGETVHLILGKLSEEDLDAAWKDFLRDMVKYLK